MRHIRLIFLLAFSTLVLLAVLWVLWERAGATAAVKDVEAGHQEVAWIGPATATDAWERLVAALKQTQKILPRLKLSFEQAFLNLSADVPEIGIWFEGRPQQKLWVRWYKLSGDNPASTWMERLRARATPPLAILGGETSDRALTLAQALKEAKGTWKGDDPLLLFTTATAERFLPSDARTSEIGPSEVAHETWPKLMEVYAGRTFRFSFTNNRMVEAVLDFVRENPQVWASKRSEPSVWTSFAVSGSPWTSLGILQAAGHGQPSFLYSLAWWDDGYSKDLAEIFLKLFIEHQRESGVLATNFYNDYVLYSVGDFNQPNPREEMAVGLFLANNARFRDQHQLLALPTGTQRARRFLRTLSRRAPSELRNIVVVTGDAVTFNNIYRDRDVAWNIQDMPVPLVFFSHRNPIDAEAGFGRKEPGEDLHCTTGTQDLLLHRDVAEALVLSAFEGDALVAGAERMLGRLKQTRWHEGRPRNPLVDGRPEQGIPFFDAAGNRAVGTGEHVVWLKPAFDGQRNLAQATISVWHVDPASLDSWRLFGEPLFVLYDRPKEEGSSVHAGE